MKKNRHKDTKKIYNQKCYFAKDGNLMISGNKHKIFQIAFSLESFCNLVSIYLNLNKKQKFKYGGLASRLPKCIVTNRPRIVNTIFANQKQKQSLLL